MHNESSTTRYKVRTEQQMRSDCCDGLKVVELYKLNEVVVITVGLHVTDSSVHLF